MTHLLKKRKALSSVVATLIILVISVLLAGVVTYYAINVVSTRVQEESLSLSDAHIWLNPTATSSTPNYSQASLKVINTGGRDVVITKVEIRGQDAAWNSWQAGPTDSQFVVYSVTTQPIQTDMYFQNSMAVPVADPATAVTPATQTLSLLGAGNTNQFTFSYATNNLVLASGNTMLLYIVNPDSITINDIGLTVSITIYTAQAMYYQECNVQAYSPVSSVV
jgi:hypothetical protein